MRDEPRLENATRTRLSQISGAWKSQKLSSNSLNYSDGRGTSGHSSGLSDTELMGPEAPAQWVQGVLRTEERPSARACHAICQHD